MVVPQDRTLPAVLFHMVASEYGGVISSLAADDVQSETIRLEVRVIDVDSTLVILWLAVEDDLLPRRDDVFQEGHVEPAAGDRRGPHAGAAAILDDGLVNFLFVGRIAPNKMIEDHIRLAEQYKRYVDAYYRFIFVGRYDVVPQYYATIRALLSDYKMPERWTLGLEPLPRNANGKLMKKALRDAGA